jgi:hypothetical protein
MLADNLIPNSNTNPDFVDSLNYLIKFREDAKLSLLWPEVEEETKKILKSYEVEVVEMIKDFKEMIDLEEPANKIVVSVNLLESYFRGFSITTPGTTYLITGPSDGVNMRNILHELLQAYLQKASMDTSLMKKHFTNPRRIEKNYPIEDC